MSATAARAWRTRAGGTADVSAGLPAKVTVTRFFGEIWTTWSTPANPPVFL